MLLAIRLKNYGFIKVSGTDACSFLQGQLSCDVNKITETQSSLGACCEPKGRIIAFFRLLKIQEDYYLRLPKSMVETLLAHLSKYAMFSKVSLSNASDTLQMIGLISDEPDPAFTNNNHHHLIHIDTKRYEYYTLELPSELSLVDDPALWKLSNIKQGIPEIYPETTEQFLPHHLNLQLIDALDFNKGCYTGQEIIARMHYRGKLKQHMYLATVDYTQPITPNAQVKHLDKPDSTVGYLIDAASDEKRQYILATIFDKFISENKLFVKGADGHYLNFVNLPYAWE